MTNGLTNWFKGVPLSLVDSPGNGAMTYWSKGSPLLEISGTISPIAGILPPRNLRFVFTSTDEAFDYRRINNRSRSFTPVPDSFPIDGINYWYLALPLPAVGDLTDIGAKKYWFNGLPLPVILGLGPTPPPGPPAEAVLPRGAKWALSQPEEIFDYRRMIRRSFTPAAPATQSRPVLFTVT